MYRAVLPAHILILCYSRSLFSRVSFLSFIVIALTYSNVFYFPQFYLDEEREKESLLSH